MKKSFILGLLFLCSVLIVSLVMNNGIIIFKISGGIGLLSILISGILLGAFVDGNRVRDNYYYEDKADRKQRFRTSNLILAFGFPNLLAAIVYYLILH